MRDGGLEHGGENLVVRVFCRVTAPGSRLLVIEGQACILRELPVGSGGETCSPRLPGLKALPLEAVALCQGGQTLQRRRRLPKVKATSQPQPEIRQRPLASTPSALKIHDCGNLSCALGELVLQRFAWGSAENVRR